MGDFSTPTLEPGVFDRNIAALQQSDPALAGRLVDTAGPPDVKPVPACTRDGRLSIRLVRADGTATWFGRTSIPGIRAQALLEKLDPGQANVLLPGVAEGTEACLLLDRIGRHRAVFVWEPEPVNVRLMLQLHNVSGSIADQRLVLIVCPAGDLTQSLVDWLTAHRGHLCPDRIMMWPWQTPAQIAPCRSAVEAAYHQIESRRAGLLRDIQASWPTGAHRSPGGDSPAARESMIALLALHANTDTHAVVDAMAGAAVVLGRRVVKVDVRAPGDMHPLARAARLAAAGPQPDMAILVDVTRHQVRDVLPPGVPAVAWLGPQAAIGPDLERQAGPDAVVFTGPVLVQWAVQCSLDPRRISVCPPPCLTDLDSDRPPDERGRSIDVLLVGDTGAVDAASVGLTLPAYAQIWRTAINLLTGQLETFDSSRADAVLARAEAKTGSRIDEPRLREQMVDALGGRAAGFLLAGSIAQVLTDNRLGFDLLGSGWAGPWAGRVVSANGLRGRAEAMARAKIVIHADATGTRTQEALLAAGSGAALIARSHGTDVEPGGLGQLLRNSQEMVQFQSLRELVGHVRRLLADDAARQAMARRAWQRCRAEHSPAARLGQLRAVVSSFLSGRGSLV